MPTYEYACKDCGSRLEVVQSFADAPLTECPSCHGALRKIFGNVGITFKGSGFYKTDSRSTGKSTNSSPTKSSSSKPDVDLTSSSKSSDSTDTSKSASSASDSKSSTDTKKPAATASSS